MSQLVSELKRLISRLAKKEVKLALRKGAGLRKENQSLRARVKTLEGTLARVVRSVAKSGGGVKVVAAGSAAEVMRFRFTAKGIKSLRKKTHLSQAQFARLLGTSPLSVSNWELGKALPRKSSDAFRKLVEVRNSKMGSRAAKKELEALAGK